MELTSSRGEKSEVLSDFFVNVFTTETVDEIIITCAASQTQSELQTIEISQEDFFKEIT